MKTLLLFTLLIAVSYSKAFHDRSQMSDWNLNVTAPNFQDCVKSFVGSKLDYCCFNSTVLFENKQIDQGNILVFSTDSGIGTQQGCSKLAKNLFGYTDNQPKSPQITFLWGENNQIIQRVQILVNETTFVQDNVTKYKYVFQIPANVINNSADTKILQNLEFVETASSQLI